LKLHVVITAIKVYFLSGDIRGVVC